MAAPGYRWAAVVCGAMALVPAPALAAEQCAETLEQLRNLGSGMHHSWRETGMRDGKPLLLSLTETQGSLWLHLHKTGEGPWASGPARVCRQQGGRVAAHLTMASLGTAAPWLLRRMMGQSPVFILDHQGGDLLQVSTSGWTGVFTRM